MTKPAKGIGYNHRTWTGCWGIGHTKVKLNKKGSSDGELIQKNTVWQTIKDKFDENDPSTYNTFLLNILLNLQTLELVYLIYFIFKIFL